MAKCCSFTATRDWCFRLSFSNAGLRSTTSDLGDGTVMHCWIPKSRKENKPNLLLIHGMGANAMWQWADFIRPLIARFNVYVPDLVFFGDSYTTRPERSESFQAQCVMRMIEGHGVSRMNVVGISYGGFVAYRIAEQFPAAVERSVLCCAGVCLEEKDMEAGMFQVSSVEDAASILLPQTPEKPTLIIWGELDRVFPLELAHRLKRHIGENAELVIIKNVGHAINAEKPKELCKYLKSFLMDLLPPQNGKSSDGNKIDCKALEEK